MAIPARRPRRPSFPAWGGIAARWTSLSAVVGACGSAAVEARARAGKAAGSPASLKTPWRAARAFAAASSCSFQSLVCRSATSRSDERLLRGSGLPSALETLESPGSRGSGGARMTASRSFALLSSVSAALTIASARSSQKDSARLGAGHSLSVPSRSILGIIHGRWSIILLWTNHACRILAGEPLKTDETPTRCRAPSTDGGPSADPECALERNQIRRGLPNRRAAPALL